MMLMLAFMMLMLFASTDNDAIGFIAGVVLIGIAFYSVMLFGSIALD